MEKVKNLLYSTEARRILMRFLEIFILAGISALIYSVELENALSLSLGAGLAAAILKFLRDILLNWKK
jgi:hypothetical protein